MAAREDADPQAAAYTLLSDVTCLEAVQKLPTELLCYIVRLAASTDRKTAHACAYVSKAVCKLTAPDRWRTIVCTNGRQFESLWQIVATNATPSSPNAGRTGKDFSSLPSHDPERLCHPGLFVENLFIDIRGPVQLSAQGHLSYHSVHDKTGLLMFLEHFPFLSYLALGPEEMRTFHLTPFISPRKLLITSDDEDALRKCLQDIVDNGKEAATTYRQTATGSMVPCWNGTTRRLRSLHIISMNQRSELTGAPMPVNELEPLRCGSLAPRSLARIAKPPPSEEDEEDEAGSRPRASTPGRSASSFNNLRNGRLPNSGRKLESFVEECCQGVAHIRYDTRKFSFRPCEITASRLRPFFEELTTTAAGNQGDQNQRIDFSHNGPRHAAPPRGAGNSSVSSRIEQMHANQVTAKRAALGLLGCNGFKKLHLCWDPVPSSTCEMATDDASAGSQSLDGRTALATTAIGSDWPVERQDIWTNTSSQNNEAQAPPPHTAANQQRSAQRHAAAQLSKSSKPSDSTHKVPLHSWTIASAVESKQSKAFRADMVDAFRSTFGWTRQDQQMLSDTNWYARGADLTQRLGGEAERLELEAAVDKVIATNASVAPFSTLSSALPDEQLTLHIVPPAERLRLGGIYVPYTKEQRVQWFLDNLDTEDA